MDAQGNIYRGLEDEIPGEDKHRFDAAVLRGEAERAKGLVIDQTISAVERAEDLARARAAAQARIEGAPLHPDDSVE